MPVDVGEAAEALAAVIGEGVEFGGVVDEFEPCEGGGTERGDAIGAASHFSAFDADGRSVVVDDAGGGDFGGAETGEEHG